MINSFQSLYTITSALVLQQLEQDVTASNLAQTSLDSNGYLMNSLERVNVEDGISTSFYSGNQYLSVGTGSHVQSITRLRSLFLDQQIQQESSVLGKAEILSQALSNIKGIVDGSSTLSTALTNFAQAWTNLAADPTNTGLRTDVVNDGVTFAQLANSQYEELQTEQTDMNGEINTTVTQINQILQQLSSINKELNTTQGSNQNSLLDARDYALDRLSRLINNQAVIGDNGTVRVVIGGITLVDSSGAAIFQTNLSNQHNPNLVGISIQSPNGTIVYTSQTPTGQVIVSDVTTLITGGNLAGELQARDVVLESYKDQVDQIATSVLNVTNILHKAGYAANGTTTGTAFFTGTGAGNISVSGGLISNNVLLAAAINPNDTTDGTIAKFLGNLPNLLGNNFMESQPGIAGATIDPTQAISSQVFSMIPVAGSFTVNQQLVTYTTADSIDSILAKINAADPNVDAVYNATSRQFFILSNNPVSLVNVSGNFAGGVSNWSNLSNAISSSIRMNNSFAGSEPKIDYVDLADPAATAMNSSILGTAFNTGPNVEAFRVTPGTSGTFTITAGNNQTYKINWTNTMSLQAIATQIAAVTGNAVTASFNTGTQTLTLYDHTPQPLTVVDNSGNFSVFTGLNGNLTSVGNLASGFLTQISNDYSNQETLATQASDSLTQLNNAQANIAGVSTGTTSGSSSTSSTPGVPIATIEQQAEQSLITYNALLQVLQVIDQMYSDLVSILGGTTSSAISFQSKTT